MKTLSSVFGDKAKKLDQAVLSKADNPTLKNLGSDEATLKYLRANLRSSYIFNRFVLPSYMACVFTSLKYFQPLDETIAPTIRSLLGMCKGELATNNVYGRNGECHSHFIDLYEAYAEAGGDLIEFENFMRLVDENGIHQAISLTEALWSEKAKLSVGKTLLVSSMPLSCFILMACNEMVTTVIYPVVLENMSSHSCFDKFRQFMRAHIDLDGNDHSDATLNWLEIYLKQNSFLSFEIDHAINSVLSLYS